MRFIERATRNLFFTGKGGVGKTSLACAAAVRLADAGKRVLLVSTDPASNLDEVLGTKLGSKPAPISGVPRLLAMNIDPKAAAAAYRERVVGPYRGVLPDAAVASMDEQFSGSCTLEIAAFDEFSRLLADPAATEAFDHVIFDTAPTGHTLRLLSLPSAWSGFIDANTTGTSCLGPLKGLKAEEELYRRSVAILGDPARTTLVLVARPEVSALREAARTSGELSALGMRNQHLVVNGVFSAGKTGDPIAGAMAERAVAAIEAMPVELRGLPRTTVPLTIAGFVGVDALRRFGLPAENAPTAKTAPTFDAAPEAHAMESLIDEIAASGHGAVLVMGKGGVGKTTVAAAVATALASRGLPVHLTTTDPAAHLIEALSGDVAANLTVGRIDPLEVTRLYSEEVMRTAGRDLDERGRALLAEDLRSPCTEEIAVFRAFAEAVALGDKRFVVLDTAPTGHTILLLDAALAFHREVARQSANMPDFVAKLLPRLRDRDFTRILIVALPEATPIHEAAELQSDLRRAGIEPHAWIVNQCLAPLAITDPVLLERRRREFAFLAEVREKYAEKMVILPWRKAAPIGVIGLAALTARS